VPLHGSQSPRGEKNEEKCEPTLLVDMSFLRIVLRPSNSAKEVSCVIDDLVECSSCLGRVVVQREIIEINKDLDELASLDGLVTLQMEPKK
jgi:hypothetical protein